MPPARAMPSPTAAKMWSVAFACCLLNLLQTSAFFFTPTTIMPLLVTDLGIPLSLSTVPIAAGKLAYVLMLVPGGVAVDAYGPRICVLAGIAGLAGLLTVYAAFVTTFSHVIAIHIAMATVSSISGVPVYSLFIAQWFSHASIGLAMGLTLAGFSLGGTISPALLAPVATEYSWRSAVACMAGALWFIALPAAYFFLDERPDLDDFATADVEGGRDGSERQPLLSSPPKKKSAPPPREAPSPPQPPPAATPVALDDKSWTFLGFALSYILLQYSFGTFAENLLFHLTLDRGWSLSFASLMFSLMNFSSFAAKLIGGHLGDKYDRFVLGSFTSAGCALGTFFLFLGGGASAFELPRITAHPVIVLLFSCVYGSSYGGSFNCLYCLVPLVFGKKGLGKTQSALFGLGLVGNACGSILTGYLRSRYGSYDRGFLIAAIACWANMIVFNITRTTLGGSMRGLKVLQEEQSPIDAAFLAKMQADEDELRKRIGANSASVSPVASSANIADSSFFGASFRSSASNERLFNQSNLPARAGTHFSPLDQPLYSPLASPSPNTESGVDFDSGFPAPSRIWSSNSLQRIVQTRRHRVRNASALAHDSEAQQDEGASNSFRSALQLSSNSISGLLNSGILSNTLEDIGYTGSVGLRSRESSFCRPPRIPAASGSSIRAHCPTSPALSAILREDEINAAPDDVGACSPQSFTHGEFARRADLSVARASSRRTDGNLETAVKNIVTGGDFQKLAAAFVDKEIDGHGTSSMSSPAEAEALRNARIARVRKVLEEIIAQPERK